MKKALLVGINYRGTDSELNGCINDVEGMSELLLSQGYQCKILTDDTVDKPTKMNIYYCWEWLLQGDPQEIFFHYSGHGSWIVDTNGDEKDRRDETLCPIDFEQNGMITDDEIRTLLVSRVKSTTRLVAIIDACHSETSFDLRYVYKLETSLFGKIKYVLHTNSYKETTGNVVIISGCKDTQTSADAYIIDRYQGVLTHSFLTLIDQSKTFKTMIKDLNKYIKEKNLSTQIPCLSFGISSSLDGIIFPTQI